MFIATFSTLFAKMLLKLLIFYCVTFPMSHSMYVTFPQYIYFAISLDHRQKAVALLHKNPLCYFSIPPTSALFYSKRRQKFNPNISLSDKNKKFEET